MEDEILESLKKYPGARLEIHPCGDGTWQLTMTKDVRYAVDEIVGKWKSDAVERAAEMLVESLK